MAAMDLLEHIIRERPTTQWDDVLGLEEAKKELLETVVLPVKFPQLFTAAHRQPPAGTLLYGAPGTGKTLMARALASQIDNATFYYVSASDFMSKYVGDREQIVKELFNKAHMNNPCVLFIDDIDIIDDRREGEWRRRVITEFLIQMENCNKIYTGTHVVAVTSIPGEIRQSIIRRFPKRIHVPLPDGAARGLMFKHFLGNSPHSLSEDDFGELGQKTEGYTGSDISCVVRDALMEPVREISKATHFKKISGPSTKDPNVIVNDLMIPCASDDPEAIEMEWTQLTEDKLFLKKINMEIMLQTLSKFKPSITEEDLVNLQQFTRNYTDKDLTV